MSGSHVAAAASKLSHLRFQLQKQRASALASIHKSASSSAIDRGPLLAGKQQAAASRGSLRKSISETFFRRSSMKESKQSQQQREEDEARRHRRGLQAQMLMQDSFEESADDSESMSSSSPTKLSGLLLPDLEPLGFRARLDESQIEEEEEAAAAGGIEPSPPTIPTRRSTMYTPDPRRGQGIANRSAATSPTATAAGAAQVDGVPSPVAGTTFDEALFAELSDTSSDYDGDIKQMSSASMLDLDLLVKGGSIDFPTLQQLSHSGSSNLMGSSSRDAIGAQRSRRGDGIATNTPEAATATAAAGGAAAASVPDGTRRLSSLDLLRANEMLREDVRRRACARDDSTSAAAPAFSVSLLSLSYLVTTLIFALARKQNQCAPGSQEQRFWDKFYNPVEESYTFVTDATVRCILPAVIDIMAAAALILVCVCICLFFHFSCGLLLLCALCAHGFVGL